MSRTQKNNSAMITGVIEDDLTFSHEINGEGFYKGFILSARKSETVDRIPFFISEQVVNVNHAWKNHLVTVKGSLRQYKLHDDKGIKRTTYALFVTNWREWKEGEVSNNNEIVLDGIICKTPVFRRTASGREVTDLLVISERSRRQSDCIRCIAWEHYTEFCSGLEVGEKVHILGRIQSRTYPKWNEDNKQEWITTYEVSINKIERIKQEELTE